MAFFYTIHLLRRDTTNVYHFPENEKRLSALLDSLFTFLLRLIVSGSLPELFRSGTDLYQGGHYKVSLSHRKNSWCHTRLLKGFVTQWPSSG